MTTNDIKVGDWLYLEHPAHNLYIQVTTIGDHKYNFQGIPEDGEDQRWTLQSNIWTKVPARDTALWRVLYD